MLSVFLVMLLATVASLYIKMAESSDTIYGEFNVKSPDRYKHIFRG